jgi:hypothetical protein
MCFADGLSFTIRFLVYRVSLRVPSHEALLLISKDRLDEADSNGVNRSVVARALAAALVILRLGFGAGTWSEAPWTLLWAGMYIFASLTLEIASQYSRWASAGYVPVLDLEAPGTTQADPVTSANPGALQQKLALMDTLLFKWSRTLHALFVLWALLDLVQPPLNKFMLSSTSPTMEVPLFLLSLPLVFAAMFTTLLGSMACGYFIMLAVSQVASFRFHLPLGTNAGKVVDIVAYGLAGAGGLVGFFATSILLGGLLLSEGMTWFYGAVAVDVVVFLMVFSVFFGLYIGLMAAVKAHQGIVEKHGFARYLDEEGLALLTGVLGTIAVVGLWYQFRYDAPEGWMQRWRAALVVDGVMGNGTVSTTD